MMERWSGPQRCGPKPVQDDKVQGISWVFSPTPFAGIWRVTECPLDRHGYPDSGMERKRVLGWEILGTIFMRTMWKSNNSR